MTSLSSNSHSSTIDRNALMQKIKKWAAEYGFADIGVSDIELDSYAKKFDAWLAAGFHGEMEYMSKHGSKRTQPNELISDTCSILSVRMDYAPADIDQAAEMLDAGGIGYISRYALGRDYHKLMRKRLQHLATRIEQEIGPFGYRVFCDSAPVLEKAIAEKAGLGWIGKHTNVLHQRAGSWFFLGEIYTDLDLPKSQPASNHCGSCRSCIDVCPTQAIVAPYQLDARRCISYLTIELRGSIPRPLRPLIGNRIYGCDDCQLFCPWNKYARVTQESDFSPRATLTDRKLLDLFDWDEATFLRNTEGTAIRRIGFISWIRNIAVALGNAPYRNSIVAALEKKKSSVNELVAEHIDWAIDQQLSRRQESVRTQ